MVTLEAIMKKARNYLPNLDETRIRSAYNYIIKAHGDVYRSSGESQQSHVLSVAYTLLELKPDENTIIAALIHNVFETPVYNLDDIKNNFGEDVASLLSALKKLNGLQLQSPHADIETLRNMFLAVAEDFRAVFIRLIDRLHQMENLQYLPVGKRKSIAYETLEIYVPIAARLGIYKVKFRLEDLCFKHLYPQQFHDLKTQLDEYLRKQEKVVDFIKYELETFLKFKGIEAEVEGRLKNLYSIYRKLKEKNSILVKDLFDIFAIRIILPTRLNQEGVELTDHLYGVLGLIHSRWIPLSHRFKDYVALPKPNGYQSLHIAVIGLTPKPLNQPTEIQIRSRKMHEQADFGVASHWLYKESKSSSFQDFSFQRLLNSDQPSDSRHDWIEGLLKLQKDLSLQAPLHPLKVDIFQDRIFVLTPRGDVKDLPKGATPVDFAYTLDVDLGHSCSGAKVNNVIVPLDYELQNGEVVEIITKSKPDPKPYWLSFLKTSHARDKVKSYFKGLDTERSFREGKQLLNKTLQQLGHVALDENLSVLKHYGDKKLSFRQRQKFLEDIGNGNLEVGAVVKGIFGARPHQTLSEKVSVFSEKENVPKKFPPLDSKDNKIFIAGEMGLPYKLSSCCKPNQSHAIVAYVNRLNALRVHVQSCKFLKNVNPARILQASWGKDFAARQHYPVKISLKALDRVGLIRDIADTVAAFQVNILDFSLQQKMNNIIQREMVLEVSDQSQFEKIIDRLSHIRNVIKVSKED